VIPAYNGLPHVLLAVDSALAQSLPPAEVVVVDDGSTDGTGDAVAARYGDRVRVVRGAFGSAGRARNAGWRAASAPWIAFLDADDLWFEDKLAVAAATLAGAPEAAWFFSDGAFQTLEGAIEPSWIALWGEMADDYRGAPLAELIEASFILTSSVVVRRDLLDGLGGFRDDMTHAEDLDLWIRLARAAPAAGSCRALVRYQHHPGGLTRQIEARLAGSATLFGRLGADASLAPELRRRARRRAAVAAYKLGVQALREGRGTEARARLAGAWLFPDRAPAVIVMWAASLLPSGWLARVRRQHWATRPVAAPLGRQRRIVLRPAAAAGAPDPGGKDA
jgi:hypothetical protein